MCLTIDATMNSIIGNVMARSPDRRATLVYSIPPYSITAMDKDSQPVNVSNGNHDFTVAYLFTGVSIPEANDAYSGPISEHLSESMKYFYHDLFPKNYVYPPNFRMDVL